MESSCSVKNSVLLNGPTIEMPPESQSSSNNRSVYKEPGVKRKFESNSSASESSSKPSSSDELNFKSGSSKLSESFVSKRKKKLSKVWSPTEANASSAKLSNGVAPNSSFGSKGGLKRMVGQSKLQSLPAKPKEENCPQKAAFSTEDTSKTSTLSQNKFARVPIWKQQKMVQDSPLRRDPYDFPGTPGVASQPLARKKSKTKLTKSKSAGKLKTNTATSMKEKDAGKKERGSKPSACVPAPSNQESSVLSRIEPISGVEDRTPPAQPKAVARLVGRPASSPHPGMRKKNPISQSSSCLATTPTVRPPINRCVSSVKLLKDECVAGSLVERMRAGVEGRGQTTDSQTGRERKTSEQTPTTTTSTATGSIGIRSRLRSATFSVSELRPERRTPVLVLPTEKKSKDDGFLARRCLTSHQSMFNLRPTPERQRNMERAETGSEGQRNIERAETSRVDVSTPTRLPSYSRNKLDQNKMDTNMPLTARTSPRKHVQPLVSLKHSATVSDLRQTEQTMPPTVSYSTPLASSWRPSESEKSTKPHLKEPVSTEIGQPAETRNEVEKKELPPPTPSRYVSADSRRSSVDEFFTPNQSFSHGREEGEKKDEDDKDVLPNAMEVDDDVFPAIPETGILDETGRKEDSGGRGNEKGIPDTAVVNPVEQPVLDTSVTCEIKSELNKFSFDRRPPGEEPELRNPDVEMKPSSSVVCSSQASEEKEISIDDGASVGKDLEGRERKEEEKGRGTQRGLLKASTSATPKKPAGRRLRFKNLEVFYFDRQQGGDTVPHSGEVTLGMVDCHFTKREFSLESGRRPLLHLNSDTEDDLSDGEVPGARFDAFDYEHCSTMCIERIDGKARVKMLKRLGIPVQKPPERLDAIRQSRLMCGCSCRNGICRPDTCECHLNGIQCQVDGPLDDGSPYTHPCWCTAATCHNPEGRVEFQPELVNIHRFLTLKRMRAMEHSGIHSSPQVTRFDDETGLPSTPTAFEMMKSPLATSTPNPQKMEVSDVTMSQEPVKYPVTPVYQKAKSRLDHSHHLADGSARRAGSPPLQSEHGGPECTTNTPTPEVTPNWRQAPRGTAVAPSEDLEGHRHFAAAASLL